MGGTPVLGIVLGVTPVSPQLMNSYLLGQQTPEVWNFGWFVIQKVGYQAQVIPSIPAGMALGWIETRLKRSSPTISIWWWCRWFRCCWRCSRRTR